MESRESRAEPAIDSISTALSRFRAPMAKRSLRHTVSMVAVLGVLPLMSASAAGPDSPPPAAEILIAAVSDDSELTAILNAHHDAKELREHVAERRTEGPHHEARESSRETMSDAQRDAREAQEDANEARNDAREAQEDANEAEQEGGSRTGGHRTGDSEQDKSQAIR